MLLQSGAFYFEYMEIIVRFAMSFERVHISFRGVMPFIMYRRSVGTFLHTKVIRPPSS